MTGRAVSDSIIVGRAAISVGNPKTSLPHGWAWAALVSVAELGTGHTPSRKHPEYWRGDVPWIGIRDAGAHHGGVIADTFQHINQLGLDNSSARLLPKDTVCLSRTASVGYVVKMGRSMATSQDFVTWSCHAPLDPDFLMQALMAEGADIRRFGEGSTHTTIYFPEVKAFHIALPPRNEQKRIVAKIEGLSKKSKRAREHLDHIPRLVEKYKQAILTSAFEGKLSPESTQSKTLEQVCEIRSGHAFKSSDFKNEGEIPVVRIGDISEGTVKFTDGTKFLDQEFLSTASNFIVERGDILVALSGATTGKSGIYQLDRPALLNQRIARLRIKAEADKQLISYFVRWIAEKILASSYGGAQPNISPQLLGSFALEWPTSVGREQIVKKVRRAFSWIDRLASETTSARKLIDHLDKAILAKAFRGELVPQDPNDERASVLLERVRAGRAGQVATKRTSRGR